MVAATAEKKEAKSADAAEGTALFPMPDSPLGKACKHFVNIVDKLGETKARMKEQEKAVLEEMRKDGRPTLSLPVGKDNYEFSIKKGEDKVRCVKKTRQPKPKAVETTEQ